MGITVADDTIMQPETAADALHDGTPAPPPDGRQAPLITSDSPARNGNTAGAVSDAPERHKGRRVYADIDLGEYDEAYAGQSLRVLHNPTRAMRREFLRSSADPTAGQWLEHMAVILDCGAGDIAQAVDDMDIEILHWLFIPRVEDGKIILPAIYDVWDRYVESRVKARAAR